jgi:AraC-like DNA-binding protein
MKVRADVALRMLESAIFRQLSIAEIGRRAGFADRAQFARVLRARSGRTPSQIRLDNAIPLVD